MTQIASIVTSLKESFSGIPSLSETLPGNIHHGERVAKDTARPFGTLQVRETAHQFNSSGVGLVDYTVTLKIYVLENTERTAEILKLFHYYWDRLRSLSALDADEARLVLVYPRRSEIREDSKKEFGKDIIVGETAWGLQLAEYKSEITE